jgi:hypothetical protein
VWKVRLMREVREIYECMVGNEPFSLRSSFVRGNCWIVMQYKLVPFIWMDSMLV